MRPILVATLAGMGMTAALPAQGQGRESAVCANDRALIARIEDREAAKIVAEGEEERAIRDRLSAVHREIAELNVSGRNPARLHQLREERSSIIATLNGIKARNARPVAPDPEIARARARMQANRCPRNPWGLPPPPPATTPGRPGWPAAQPLPPAPRPPAGRPAAVAPAQPDGQYSAWMTGAFSTAWGRTTLSPTGGSYEYEGGSITVTSINGPVMEGIWRQTGSGSCPDQGHWGRFRFTFTASGFTGVFGHCNGPLNQGDWNGTRIR